MNKNFILNSSLLRLLFLFSVSSLLAQTDFSLETEIVVQSSSQEELPFWMYSNQRGRTSSETNALGLLKGKIQHVLPSRAVVELGAAGVFHDGFPKNFALDEVYLQFRNHWFYATGGIKQHVELYHGLSGTNQNILWSFNARPLPGIEIGTLKPVFVFPGIGFEVRWGEYILEEDRHVPWARVHHKKFNFVLQPSEDWQIKAGIQHYAQWGGVSPEWGLQPEGLTDYLRIVLGRQGSEEALQGDINNSLGNHTGSGNC